MIIFLAWEVVVQKLIRLQLEEDPFRAVDSMVSTLINPTCGELVLVDEDADGVNIVVSQGAPQDLYSPSTGGDLLLL